MMSYKFIDSDTLREMLRGKELAPALECILFAQSRKWGLAKEQNALTVRLSDLKKQAVPY